MFSPAHAVFCTPEHAHSIRNVVRIDFLTRMDRYHTCNNNNNDFFLHLGIQHMSRMHMTTRGFHWRPAGLGTTQTHRPVSPRPPGTVRESHTPPDGRYTHSWTAGASSAFFGNICEAARAAVAGGGDVGDGGDGSGGIAHDAAGGAAAANRPHGGHCSI